jgi:hypothetical protein
MKSISTLLLLGALATGVFAQRPRSMDPQPSTPASTTPAATTSAARSVPKTVKAKYEGGVFGYNKKMEGMLTFDDLNSRMVFRDNKTPKVIAIPYDAITSAFADTKKVQPAAATVASNVPTIYSLPAHFIKTKVRYLTLQYSDPDSKISGITSFKLENKELLESVLVALAEKANMTLRGDVYVKKKPEDSSKATPDK